METIDLIVLMTLVVVLYIIIAVLKCVHHINVIKNWGRIEEILYTLPNHDENDGRPQCLGMSYEVNFLGGLGSNEFHIKYIFGS